MSWFRNKAARVIFSLCRIAGAVMFRDRNLPHDAAMQGGAFFCLGLGCVRWRTPFELDAIHVTLSLLWGVAELV